MRRFFRLPNLLVLALGILIVNACTVDEEPFVFGPNVSFGTGTDFISENATVGANAVIRVNLIATKGDNPMQNVEFLENNVRIDDLNRITLNTVNPAPSNAPLLFDTEVDAIDWDISIVAPTSGTHTYTFVVNDNSGNSNQVSLDITIQNDPPTLSFVGSGGTLTTTADTWDEKKVTVDANGNILSTISVWQDGALITDLTRISFGDIGTNFSANPLDLTGDDVNGLTDKSVYIKSQDDGTSTYTIQVETAGGLTANASYDIAIMATGTPIGALFTGVLLENAAGNDPTGGIDLYAGNTVSVNDPLANIIDLGNNTAGTAWLAQIGGANGATLRAISTAQVDAGFTLAELDFIEQVKEAYDISDALSNNESAVVEMGDFFFVNVGDDYFALEVKEKGVNVSGLGFYRFDIVKAEF